MRVAASSLPFAIVKLMQNLYQSGCCASNTTRLWWVSSTSSTSWGTDPDTRQKIVSTRMSRVLKLGDDCGNRARVSRTKRACVREKSCSGQPRLSDIMATVAPRDFSSSLRSARIKWDDSFAIFFDGIFVAFVRLELPGLGATGNRRGLGRRSAFEL